MKISFTIPDAKANRIIDGVCGHYGYQETVTDEEGKEVTNSESKTQFVKRQMIKFLKDPVITHEMKQARKAENDTIKTDIEKINIS